MPASTVALVPYDRSDRGEGAKQHTATKRQLGTGREPQHNAGRFECCRVHCMLSCISPHIHPGPAAFSHPHSTKAMGTHLDVRAAVDERYTGPPAGGVYGNQRTDHAGGALRRTLSIKVHITAKVVPIKLRTAAKCLARQEHGKHLRTL